jgi:heme O synthase-like polyprenyltransferase
MLWGALVIFACVAFGVWHDRRIDRHMREMFRRDDD